LIKPIRRGKKNIRRHRSSPWRNSSAMMVSVYFKIERASQRAGRRPQAELLLDLKENVKMLLL
jgi:hypothetical protein